MSLQIRTTGSRWRLALALVLALVPLASCRRAAAPARDSIVIAVPHEVVTLDPHAEDTLASFSLHSNLYEPIVATDGSMRIEPCLADRWETPDPQTWVFHLRPSVRFHSGKPLRAADVVASYERLIRGKDLQMRTYLLDVSEVTEVDALTVQVRTSKPSSIFLNRLSQVLIVPREHGDLASAADGTGPYALGAWTAGQSLDLVRSDRYWGKVPVLPRVRFALGRTPADAIEGLLAGRYQLVQCDSKKAESAIGGSGRFQLLRRDNLFVKYIGLDLSRDVTPFAGVRPNPFKDKRVRQAIHAAIDRRKLVAGLSGYAVPATQPVPRFVFGFNPDIPEAAYDPDRARLLLGQAGLGSGFDAVLHARRILGETGSLVREALAGVGIRLDVRIVPDAEFYDLVQRREATLWLSRFGCAAGDASELLVAMIHSRDVERGFGLNNWEGYSDRDVDEAIERSAGIKSPEERGRALQAIMAAVMDDLVLIPLYSDQDVYAIDRDLSWDARYDSMIRAAEIGLRK